MAEQAAVAEQVERTVPIQSVQLGARIATRNPNRWDYDHSLPEPQQPSWSKLSIELVRDDGGIVQAELLRPTELIQRLGLEPGRRMHFTLHELDLSSWGTVTAIEPCPPIAPGQGQVVTGRFTTRQVEEITRVELEDGTELSGTPVHPVWSVDRQDWIALGNLQPAERLLSRRGEVAVTSVATSLWRQPVYNLEVHGEHVYEVADAGVLVHNTYESNAVRNAVTRYRDKIDELVAASKPSQRHLADLPTAPAILPSRLKQLTEAAAKSGYRLTKFRSHGQPVFTNGKRFITPDVDGHNGGVWKMATSLEELGSRTARLGTFDANLRRIGR